MTRRASDRVSGIPETPLREDVFFALELPSLGRLAVSPLDIHVSPAAGVNKGQSASALGNRGLTLSATLGEPLPTLARS